MDKSLKGKAISGMIWNAVERFGSSFFLFLANLVLARLLSPDDFGCVGMLMVFISVSDAIVDGGFGSALIQKKNPTQIDYSTIFFWNLSLSVLLYGLLFLCSDSIARFYKIPLLSDVLKVQGIIVVINALTLVQRNILQKTLLFKKLAQINLVSIIFGTALGIICAYKGLGVWSLVIKTIATGVFQTILFWGAANWRPLLVFSITSIRSLFHFGGYVFLATIVNTVYQNIIPLIVGKNISSATLGFYSQARKMEEVPRNTLSSVVRNVSFPVLSQIQDDPGKLKDDFRAYLCNLAFVNYPLMLLLIILANPIFTVLFTDKWSQAVPYFQILCVGGMIVSISELNNSLLKSIGKSNLFFVLMTISRIVGIALVFIGMIWGIFGLLIGFVASQYIGFFISSCASKRLINYGVLRQIIDTFPTLLISLVSAGVTFLFLQLIIHLSSIIQILILFFLYSVSYVVLAKLFNISALNVFLNILKVHKK